jgi:GNAT superfamily N-acetyltransferase
MLQIEPLQRGDWEAALELALARLDADRRAAQVAQGLRLLAGGTIDPGAVRVARANGGAIIGVQVCVPLAGASCLFWLPSATDDVADALVQACLQECQTRGVKIAQAFIAPAELALAGPLLRQGFRHITSVHQLRHELRAVPSPIPSPLRLTSLPYVDRADFARALQRTYHGTLDCPELNGQRTIEEIIAGHQAEGRFNPARWWLAYEGDEPIGVLMLMEMIDGTTWDLSYVGIVPEKRRHGHGRTLVQHALRYAHEQSAARLIVAADARNVPAQRLYRSMRFEAGDDLEVLLRFFDSSTRDDGAGSTGER